MVQVPTLDELSAIAAEQDPHRVAFGDASGRTIDWATYHERVARAANAFADVVAQGDRIALLCDCSIEHTVLWHGAIAAGAIPSNLHTRASVETITHCVESLHPRVLVVDDAFRETADRVLDRAETTVQEVVTIGADDHTSADALLADRPATLPDVRCEEDDVAAIIWTSGTTGTPTGWCHTHRGLAHKAMHLERYLAMERTARQPHVFTPSFAAWYSLVLPGLYAHGATHFLRDWDPQGYAALIEQRELTTAVLIPTMWRELLGLDELGTFDLDSLERVMASGERLDRTTLDGLRTQVCDAVYNSYAATEVLGTVISDEELTPDRVESVGKPIAGTQLRIVEASGTPTDVVPTGEIGEILVKGPDRAVRAWNDAATTEAAFTDDWWHSGDLGYRDEDGYVFVEGRADFMLKSKGIKIFPTPIEERLADHPGVAAAAVIDVDDPEYGEKVLAVVHRSDPTVDADTLNDWCLESDDLGRFERPRDYRFVEESLPRTATGKLDRASIQSRLEG